MLSQGLRKHFDYCVKNVYNGNDNYCLVKRDKTM